MGQKGHIWSHMIICGPHMAIYGDIWTIHGPYITRCMYGHVWPYMDHMWTYMAMYGYVWSCITIFERILPYMIIYCHKYRERSVAGTHTRESAILIRFIGVMDTLTENMQRYLQSHTTSPLLNKKTLILPRVWAMKI